MDSGDFEEGFFLRIFSLPEYTYLSFKTMSNPPPLEPPPFGPAHARKCVRITQPIRNYETPREVLILTSIRKSIDEALLNAEDSVEPPNDTDRDSDVDISDISETSSSTEDCEDEGDDGGQKSPQNQGFLEAFLVTYCIHEVRHSYLIFECSLDTTAHEL